VAIRESGNRKTFRLGSSGIWNLGFEIGPDDFGLDRAKAYILFPTCSAAYLSTCPLPAAA
jgi:hypothetical protein